MDSSKSERDPSRTAQILSGFWSQVMSCPACKPLLRSLQDETLMLNVRNPNVDVLRLCVWDADTFSQERASEEMLASRGARVIFLALHERRSLGACDRSR